MTMMRSLKSVRITQINLTIVGNKDFKMDSISLLFLITTKVWTILRLLLTWQRSAIGSYQLSASCLLKWLILTVKDPEITFYKFPADVSVFPGRYPVFISYPSSLSKVNQNLKPVWKGGETYVQILILQTLL